MQTKFTSHAGKIFRLAAALIILFTTLTFASASALTADFTALDFVANIETIGVTVSGANLPAAAELLYRQSGETVWRQGHPLTKMDDGRLIGSLFGLSPSTTYEVKARDGNAEITGAATTQADEIQFAPSTILYVDGKAALNGDGSISAPFKKIQDAVNRAGAGTQILVADGVYREAITFPNSGAENNWIQIKAQGSGAILDGARTLSGNVWTPVAKNVWFTKITAPIAYLARDQKRYYMYDNLTGLMNGVGHNKVAMREGFYIAPNTTRLYVRSLDNPARHIWKVPLLNEAIKTDGRDWLWIEGFEIRFYGSQYGCGICMKNASHVVIRNNKIHNLQKGIFIEWTGGDASGNDTRIEYNEIYDPFVNAWPWKAVKATSMEGTGIVLRGHIGAIVRGNNIHNFFNGIYTGSSGDMENSALAFDADIYDNNLHHISDDALEPEGACVNQRFRNNAVNTTLVGISLAPITQGPVWVLRSTFANYTGRGIKLDRNSDGAIFIYHNTFWTNQINPNAADLISAAHNVTMLDNIFQNNHYAVYAVPLGLAGNHWDSNDWYSAFSPRFKWENINYASVAALCRGTGLECNGYGDAPQLTNPSGGDFTLLPSSPNIDRGV
ncbi:MAG: right-handed parallel beta-helix repeat-containing protein, partial [Anaerolineales bacterium]|nr:right-handed parallel beta-helix repeat-containing protein [Anaerolineales bacterium]